jgi:hypothetical protein
MYDSCSVRRTAVLHSSGTHVLPGRFERDNDVDLRIFSGSRVHLRKTAIFLGFIAFLRQIPC